MKFIFTSAILGVLLVACSVETAPGEGRCSSMGVCIRTQVSQPIRLNEPITVTSTITSDKDFQRVSVAFTSDMYYVQIENNQVWQKGTQGDWFTLKAGQPLVVSRRFLVTQEGRFYIITAATAAFHIEDWVYVILSKSGGEIYYPGDAVPTAAFKFGSTVPPDQRPQAPLTPPELVPTQPPYTPGHEPVITAPPPTSMFGIPPPTLPLTYTPAIPFAPTPPPPPAYP